MLTETQTRTLNAVQLPVTDTFVTMVPRPNEDMELNSYGPANTHILVVRQSSVQYRGAQSERIDIPSLIGTIQRVRPSANRDAWFYSVEGERGGVYLEGPIVNPEPVNGHHYREINTGEVVEDRMPFILRYNDDDHTDDRGRESLPWTVVEANNRNLIEVVEGMGEPRWASPSMWVEVQWPAPAADGVNLDLIFGVDLASEPDHEPALGRISNVITGHTMGRGHVEEDGTVLLSPPLVEGQAYLLWQENVNWFTDRTSVAYYHAAENSMAVLGYLSRDGWSNNRIEFMSDLYARSATPGGEDSRWVKMALTAPEEAAGSPAIAAGLLATRETEFNQFEDLNDRLNVLARDQSWCGEYERTMEDIGMRHRRGSARMVFDPDGEPTIGQTRHAWQLEISVDFTGEIEYVRSGLESEIESAADFNGSVSNVRFDASTSITISGIVADDEDSARDMIGSIDIENEMDSRGITYSDIDDWNINSVEEDTDYDWDDFEG